MLRTAATGYTLGLAQTITVPVIDLPWTAPGQTPTVMSAGWPAPRQSGVRERQGLTGTLGVAGQQPLPQPAHELHSAAWSNRST